MTTPAIRAVVLAAGAAACAGPAHAPARPPANAAATAPPAATSRLVPREEIARRVVPPSVNDGRALIVGRWEGRRYDYDSDRDFAGEPGDSPWAGLELSADGKFRRTGECDQGGTYAVDRERDAMILVLDRTWTCHGPDRYAYPSYIHRLDADLLVLMRGGLAVGDRDVQGAHVRADMEPRRPFAAFRSKKQPAVSAPTSPTTASPLIMTGS